MKRLILPLLALALITPASHGQKTAQSANGEYISQRPAVENRLFTSTAVEAKIKEVTGMLTNPKLAWMFSNCYKLESLDVSGFDTSKVTDLL